MTAYTPPKNPRLRVIEALGRHYIVLGTPGDATFDLTPEEAAILGMALMETGVALGGKVNPVPKINL